MTTTEPNYKERIIAHRGNLYGADPLTENSPEAILHAIDEGFPVEFDFRITGDLTSDFTTLGIGLGHDSAQYELTPELMIVLQEDAKAFLHAKDGISYVSNMANWDDIFHNIHVDLFYNDTDLVTVTYNGYKWLHPDFDNKFDLIAFGVVDDRTVFVLGEDQRELAVYLLKYTDALVCCDYGASLVATLEANDFSNT